MKIELTSPVHSEPLEIALTILLGKTPPYRRHLTGLGVGGASGTLAIPHIFNSSPTGMIPPGTDSNDMANQ